jgi:hypothetical protein
MALVMAVVVVVVLHHMTSTIPPLKLPPLSHQPIGRGNGNGTGLAVIVEVVVVAVANRLPTVLGTLLLLSF